jgi:cell division septum initiation protein DivIVA
MKLYEIDAAIAQELEFLEQAEETGETPESIKERLDALQIERETKLAAIVAVAKNLNAEAEACEAEAKRLKARAAHNEKRVEGLKWYVSQVLKGEKWGNGVHAISYRNSEAVEVVDDAKIPSLYMREVLYWEPDKKQIREDLKSGATIPGVELRKNVSVQFK